MFFSTQNLYKYKSIYCTITIYLDLYMAYLLPKDFCSCWCYSGETFSLCMHKLK